VVALPTFSSPMALILLMETASETKLLGLYYNGISFFGFFFCCSFNHVFLTLFPFDQSFNQLRIYNCSPIDRFSMICSGNHHGRFIANILHLIFLVDNGKNCNNSTSIL